MTVIEEKDVKQEDRPQSGRRHLDGSKPGEGMYLSGVTVSLRPDDIAALEEIGGGNRSAAVRHLLEIWRTQPVWQRRDDRLPPVAAGT